MDAVNQRASDVEYYRCSRFTRAISVDLFSLSTERGPAVSAWSFESFNEWGGFDGSVPGVVTRTTPSGDGTA